MEKKFGDNLCRSKYKNSLSSIVLADKTASLNIRLFVQNLLEAAAAAENDDYELHLVLCAIDRADLMVDPRCTFVHDCVCNECDNIDDLLKAIGASGGNSVSRRKILVVDDFSQWSLFLALRDRFRLKYALSKLKAQKDLTSYVFGSLMSLHSEEVGLLCDAVDAFSVIHTMSTQHSQEHTFLCSMVRNHSNYKVTEKSSFIRINGSSLMESEIEEKKMSVDCSKIDQKMSSLTTFKLSLEENEAESRKNLHLPFFNAQKLTVDDPAEQNYYDDSEEEEDEEI